jgi:hypothetical protein
MCGCEEAMAGKKFSLRREIKVSEEIEIARRKMRNGGGVRNG